MSSVMNHPRVELVPTASLVANPRNARTHGDKQATQLAASIERFGFLVPIIADDDGMIAAGHGRWLAARKLKLAEVPVIRARFLTDADRRAFALADNRLTELSGWDETILAAELNALFEDGFNLDITGFSTSDLDLSIGEPETSRKPERVELPDGAANAVSRVGDLWLIGPHRLYNGDARDTVSYEALLGDELAAMVFSDPPYGVKIDGHVSGLGQVRHREFVMMSGEQSPAELTRFLRAVFRLCVRFAIGGSIHYHCMDWRHCREILDAADGIYAEFKQLIVWDKINAGMGSFYRSQYELLFAFKAGKGRHINNFGLGQSGRYRTNIWKMPGANTFRKGRARDLADHPTVKPTGLVADAILDCSNRGDLILDPFCGSGATLMAAHKTKRRGAAIEFDPLYVDTAIRRLRDACKFEARLADGRTFEKFGATGWRRRIVADDYEVGYGKPPRHSRFKPGQSGNPKGRQKGARGLKTDLMAALDGKQRVKFGDQHVTGRRQKLALLTLASRAAVGDLRAHRTLLPLIVQVLGIDDRGGERRALSNSDQALLDELLADRSNDAGANAVEKDTSGGCEDE